MALKIGVDEWAGEKKSVLAKISRARGKKELPGLTERRGRPYSPPAARSRLFRKGKGRRPCRPGGSRRGGRRCDSRKASLRRAVTIKSCAS